MATVPGAVVLWSALLLLAFLPCHGRIFPSAEAQQESNDFTEELFTHLMDEEEPSSLRTPLGNLLTGKRSGEPHKLCEGTPQLIDIVEKFGAVPDGKTDAAPAIVAAFQLACTEPCSVVFVPPGNFFATPFQVNGPCSQVTFLLDGTITAPDDPFAWPVPLPKGWIVFEDMEDLQVIGQGRLEVQGQRWWDLYRQRRLKNIRPVGILFRRFRNLSIRGITIVDAPKMHMVLSRGVGATIEGVTIQAPEDSPNTDGINLARTTDVVIRQSTISCGDDIIAVKPMCSDVLIEGVSAGSGHGISIGSLGERGTVGCIQNIHVRNVVFRDTTIGVRVKTWDGGYGAVQNVIFEDSYFYNVKSPIVIDQFYCPHTTCKEEKIGVAIYNVSFANLVGSTTLEKPMVDIKCSSGVPCMDIFLKNIRIEHSGKRTICSNVMGSADDDISLECNLANTLSTEQEQMRKRSMSFCRFGERSWPYSAKDDLTLQDTMVPGGGTDG